MSGWGLDNMGNDRCLGVKTQNVFGGRFGGLFGSLWRRVGQDGRTEVGKSEKRVCRKGKFCLSDLQKGWKVSPFAYLYEKKVSFNIRQLHGS